MTKLSNILHRLFLDGLADGGTGGSQSESVTKAEKAIRELVNEVIATSGPDRRFINEHEAYKAAQVEDSLRYNQRQRMNKLIGGSDE